MQTGFEIYFGDLTEEAQEDLICEFGPAIAECQMPIAVCYPLDYEDEDEFELDEEEEEE